MAGNARIAVKTAHLTLLSILIFAASGLAAQPAKIWEEQVKLPTYEVGQPDLNPMFFKGEVYQGASKVIYPYPFQDVITDNRAEKPWKAVNLENEYIKVSFFPEMGGKLFSAIDKTNKYDFFYRQISVKPSLIGMLGAWTSGGVEWCVLHHHRNTTYLPVDYSIVENPDGSKTLYFGETELRHRMKWVLAATVRPGKSYIEVTGKIYNRTAVPVSFLFWANVAVHVNDDYQVIFPPSIDYGVYHAKNDFVHWPIGDETYQGHEYKGVDLSWWKNHPEPVSFFAYNLRENFAGGYDHGKEAGVVHIGNHHVVAAAKLWEWSPGPTGRMWDRILADNNEPYAEVMVGAFSDNQPDYSWIGPHETKTFTICWYPVREIGGFKNANLNAAVNLELTKDNKAKLGFNATSPYPRAKAILKSGEKNVFEKTIDISPDKPFVTEVAVPAGTKDTDLTASLLSSAGAELVSYKPIAKTYDPCLPDTVKPPPSPKDVPTVEELYLAGLRIMQFYNPTVDPYPYFDEALRRDPCDSRVNTVLGLDFYKRAMYPEAEQKLRTAVERIAKNYTRPRNCEPYFQLGLVLKAQGKLDDAYDNLYRATWDFAYHPAAYYELAEISCTKGNFAQALEQIDSSLSTNAANNKAKGLKVAILRNLGKADAAKQLASQILADDPIDFLALNELYLAAKSGKTLADLTNKMRDNAQSYVELASDYFSFGMYDNALDVLNRAAQSKNKSLSAAPMIHYWLGFVESKKGDKAAADKSFDLAAKMPLDLTQPFRNEDIDVLNAAVAHNPKDATAYYLLGNCLYDKNAPAAIAAWEKSRDANPSFASVHRNLGWGYYRSQNDIPKAIAAYEKSIECRKDPRVFTELDQLYEIGGISPDKRAALLDSSLETVKQRNDSYTRYIMALVQVGRYDDAIKALDSTHFHAREGGTELRDVYVDAHLLRGKQRMDAQRYADALADLLAATEYPDNLEIGRPKTDGRSPQINYCIASAYEAMGDSAKAANFFAKAAAPAGPERRRGRGGEGRNRMQWWQALAMLKTDQPDKAKEIFDTLIETGNKQLTEETSMDFFAKFGERETKEARHAEAYYLIAIGQVGNKDYDAAKTALQKAIELNPNHLWAKAQLAAIK